MKKKIFHQRKKNLVVDKEWITSIWSKFKCNIKLATGRVTGPTSSTHWFLSEIFIYIYICVCVLGSLICRPVLVILIVDNLTLLLMWKRPYQSCMIGWQLQQESTKLSKVLSIMQAFLLSLLSNILIPSLHSDLLLTVVWNDSKIQMDTALNSQLGFNLNHLFESHNPIIESVCSWILQA